MAFWVKKTSQKTGPKGKIGEPWVFLWQNDLIRLRRSGSWGMVALKGSRPLERHQFSKILHLLAYTRRNLSPQIRIGQFFKYAALASEDCNGTCWTSVVSTSLPREGERSDIPWLTFGGPWTMSALAGMGLLGWGCSTSSGWVFGGLVGGSDGEGRRKQRSFPSSLLRHLWILLCALVLGTWG